MSKHRWAIVLLLCCFYCSGCQDAAVKRTEKMGPTGEQQERHQNDWGKPPAGLYVLEQSAGALFANFLSRDWLQAEKQSINMADIWTQSKNKLTENAATEKTDAAFAALQQAINDQSPQQAVSALEQFMGLVANTAKPYVMSPLADIITVANRMRSIRFAIAQNDWKKAGVKVGELEKTWNQVKPSLEKPGVLAEVTKAHSAVQQWKDSIAAEDPAASKAAEQRLNSALANIRDFYAER